MPGYNRSGKSGNKPTMLKLNHYRDVSGVVLNSRNLTKCCEPVQIYLSI